MITLKKVTVNYGANQIYKDFNFQFAEGVNVVLGQSGSGKTTLLNVIANLIPHSGECVADNVAIVFQTPTLSPVSVSKNVEMVVMGKKNTRQIDEILKLAQIDHLKDRKATILSGGEQQRVAIARAFVADRPVLLLDEPFQSLDIGIKRKLYQTLDILLNNYNKTVVLVTHDIDEALALADRIYLLNNRPCKLTQVATLDSPRAERSEYTPQWEQLRKHLQELLINQ